MSRDASGFANPSLLLQRNIEQLQAERLLIAGMPDDRWLLELADLPTVEHLSALTTDFDVYSALHAGARGALKAADVHFGVTFSPAAEHDLLILYARKGRDETDLLLRLALPALKPGGRILLVGENKAGIKSQGRILEALGSWHKLDSARHCTLFEGCYEHPQPALDLGDLEQRYQLQIAGQTLTICTLPGVFSYGRLDEGTRLLLEQLPKERLAGDILDFGCGAGVIAAWVMAAAAQPVRLTLLDNSALALEAARRTLAANGFEASLVGSNGLMNVQQPFDFLLSNPPFHTGVKTNYAVTEQFLRQVPEYLCPGGELWLVANSFLRYAPILLQSIGNCDQVFDNRRFSVYRAER